MTDTLVTPRFTLPLLAVAQAQKEVTHNEALALIDALLHPAVEAGPLATPPSAPDAGQCWLVAAGAGGEWSGQAGKIAIRTDGGWRFAPPYGGMRVIRLSDGALLRFEGGLWTGPATIPVPTGGATVDVETRAAIAALLSVLDAHGILISG